MNPYYVWFIIFACLGYLIITDLSIAKLVVYLSGLLRFQYEKVKFWLWMNPKTPWARFMMWRRAYKLAKELREELESKSK
jgi:hypothetical protein